MAVFELWVKLLFDTFYVYLVNQIVFIHFNTFLSTLERINDSYVEIGRAINSVKLTFLRYFPFVEYFFT